MPAAARPIEARTALQRGGPPDSFTKALYKISPYRGCSHGCLYCDGRAEKYFVEGDFARDILYRSNLLSLLETEVPRAREKGIVSFGSGTTDPYQPCEESLGITRRSAELVAQNPILAAAVLTKSTLALRDLDIWKQINKNSGFILMTTITTMDAAIAARFEPGAPPPSERMAMAKAFSQAGCKVVILAMPLLPGISDLEESMARLFSAAREAGADALMPGGLTLRPGRQKDLYLSAIAEHYPDLCPLYEEMYRENRPSGAPRREFSRALEEKAAVMLENQALPWLLPHSAWAPMTSLCDGIHILFADMLMLYSARPSPVDTRPLSKAMRLYEAWLADIKTRYRRHKNLPVEWVDETLVAAIDSGNFGDIIGNAKLASFVSAIVREGKRFDYRSLKLQH